MSIIIKMMHEVGIQSEIQSGMFSLISSIQVSLIHDSSKTSVIVGESVVGIGVEIDVVSPSNSDKELSFFNTKTW